jgi:hypothetical protein
MAMPSLLALSPGPVIKKKILLSKNSEVVWQKNNVLAKKLCQMDDP